MKELTNTTLNITNTEGITPILELEDADLSSFLAPRRSNSHKGNYGYIGLIGGSLNYSGAIRLAAIANCAMRSGAGVVKIALPRSLSHLILPDILDATVFPLSDNNGCIAFDEKEFENLISGLSVIAFGMGIGQSDDISHALAYLLKHYTGTLIIDADGLNTLARLGANLLTSASCNIVLTPHPKEFSRLTGKDVKTIVSNPIPLAVDFAREYNCTVLLKGNESVITDGSKIIVNKKGCAGMATAGSGDVLSGIMAAIFGWGKSDNVTLAALAAYIAGSAGILAQSKTCDISMTASDTAMCVAQVISKFQKGDI